MKTNSNTFWDKQSFMSIIKKSLPIIIASMLNAFVPFIDNIVAGSISSDAEAAITYSLTIQFTLFMLVLGGFGAIGIVMAQYKGKGDLTKTQDAHKLKLLYSLAITVPGAIIVFIFPEQLLGIFTDKQAIINQGKDFLRLYGVVFVLNGLATAYIGSLSSMGYTTISIIVTAISISVNTGLDYALVNGAHLGTSGLAYATITVEASLLISLISYALIKKAKEILFSIFKIFKISKDVLMKSLHRWHMVVVELSFGFGMLTAAVFMAKGYDGAISAGAVLGVITPFTKITFAAIGGFYAAIAIFVSSELGKDNFKLAYMNSKRIMIMSLGMILIISSIFATTSQWIVQIYYGMDAKSLDEAVMILRLFPLIIPGMMFGILSYRLLEAGGQSKTIMIFDFVNTWVFYVLSIYLIFIVWTPDHMWVAWILSQAVRYIRAGFGMYLIQDKLWLVNLTKDKAKEPQGGTYVMLSIVTLGLYPLVNKGLGKLLKSSE